MSKLEKITDFHPQVLNANNHTERGAAMLEGSIRNDGPIGAITAAADGGVFAGSLRLEKFAEVMPSAELIIVYSDGTKPVVVVRTDIPSADDPRAKRLGVADNAIASMSWNPDGAILAMLIQEEAERQEAQIKQYAALDDKAAEAILEAAGEINVAGFSGDGNDSREASVWNKMTSDPKSRKFEFGEFRLLLSNDVHAELWNFVEARAVDDESKASVVANVILEGIKCLM